MPQGEVGFLFDPANSHVVGAWGLIVSLVGFAVTIAQLFRTHSALKSANDATAKLRTRLAGQSAAIHAANAEARLKAAQKELRAGDWTAALDALESLRAILMLLYRRQDHIEQSIRDQLPPYLTDLKDFCDYLDRRGSTGVTIAKKNTMMKKLRELDGLLTNMADHLSERQS